MEDASKMLKGIGIILISVVSFSSKITYGQAPNASAIEIGKFRRKSQGCQH